MIRKWTTFVEIERADEEAVAKTCLNGRRKHGLGEDYVQVELVAIFVHRREWTYSPQRGD